MIVLGACADCAGNQLPFAPEVSGFAVLTYRRPFAAGELRFTTEAIYRDDMFGGPDNIPDAAVDSWSEINFRLGYGPTPTGRSRCGSRMPSTSSTSSADGRTRIRTTSLATACSTSGSGRPGRGPSAFPSPRAGSSGPLLRQAGFAASKVA